jgi:hypothetical protein
VGLDIGVAPKADAAQIGDWPGQHEWLATWLNTFIDDFKALRRRGVSSSRWAVARVYNSVMESRD